MTLTVVGRHVEISDAFREQCTEKIETALTKYFDRGFSGHMTLTREGHQFRAECRIHLDSGVELVASGDNDDAYHALELAVAHLEKRLRRYNRRLKNHHRPAGKQTEKFDRSEEKDYVIQTSKDDGDGQKDDIPVIIAEKTTSLPTLSVSDAVSEMNLRGVEVLMFRQIGDNTVNVIYHRDDGNIGWINPSVD